MNETKAHWEEHYGERDRVWSGRVNVQFADVAADLPPGRALDLGCGEGADSVWLAERGWNVVGLDLSRPMLDAAADRVRVSSGRGRTALALSSMSALPIASRSMDLVVAHGIWNLARSGAEFRAAVREAARVARPGAGLFVFTFSRRTLRESAQPIAGKKKLSQRRGGFLGGVDLGVEGLALLGE